MKHFEVFDPCTADALLMAYATLDEIKSIYEIGEDIVEEEDIKLVTALEALSVNESYLDGDSYRYTRVD